MYARSRSGVLRVARVTRVVTVSVLLLLRAASASASGAASGAPVRVATEPSLSPLPVQNAVHDELRRRITQFQDAWRRLWETARTTLDGRLNAQLVVENASDDPRVRRQAALQCYIGTPMLAPYAFGEVVARRPVVTIPDRGAICPMWFPPGGDEPSNEAESIDLALRLSDRRRARTLRDKLIGAIEAAHAKHPADDWIAGQRVRFVHDQGTPAQTLAAAQACRGTAGWCAMLTGLAYAQADQLVDAEGAFRQADALGVPVLDSLSGGCAAREALLLLPREARQAMARDACTPESAALERLWWLADPLWSTAGNERYVAHQARRTLIALRSVLERDERYVWEVAATGLSLRETIVRYGWPNYTFWPGGQYELRLASQIESAALGPSAAAAQVTEFALPPMGNRRRTGTGTGTGTTSIRVAPPAPKVVGPRIARLPFTVKEYTIDQTALLPTVSVILDPTTVRASDWTLTNPAPGAPDAWWPQEFLQLKRPLLALADGQSGFWRRDTTVRVAHIVELPVGMRATLDSATDMAFLAGGASPIGTRLVARATLTPTDAMRFDGVVPSGPVVLSAELLTTHPSASNYRNRFGATAPSTLRDMAAAELALSAPVFLRLPQRGVSPPFQLGEVIPQMASRDRFARTDVVALYWESYGFPVGEPLQITLQVLSTDGTNAIQRLGALIGVVGQRDSIGIRWTEREPTRLSDTEATMRPVTVHGVGLDLSPLAPGTYVVRIEFRTRADQSARNERQLSIVRP